MNLTGFNHAGYRMLFLAWIDQPGFNLRNIERQNKIHLACFFNKSHLVESYWNHTEQFLTPSIKIIEGDQSLRGSDKHLIRLLILHDKLLVPANRKNKKKETMSDKVKCFAK